MPFFSKKTNSSKTKESSTESKRVTITKNGGTTVSTSVTTTKCQNVSSSSSSETVIQASSSWAAFDETSIKDFGIPTTSKIATDGKVMNTFPKRYSSRPYRSITSATYQPMTTRQNNLTSANGSKHNPSASWLSSPTTPSLNVRQVAPAIDLNYKVKIAVKKSSKFYDDNGQSKIPVYKTRSKNRGKLLLINNVKFLNDKHERAGAELDDANLKILFEEIGFKVVRHQNLTKKDMEDKIKNFRDDSSLSKVDIGCVIVMSHGTGHERSDSTQVLCSDGQLVETTWIINQFNNALCKHLSGKPKMFIFQCCRGNAQDVQYDAVPLTTDQRTVSDMLLAYSTVPGYVSNRDPKYGSLYIQSICEVFMEHAHDTHVEDLLKMVDDKLSKFASNGMRQTPSFENRGFKNCYLHPKLSE